MQETDQALKDILPPEAAGQVQVADCSGRRLVVLVESAAWATRLRYQSAAISRQFEEKTGLLIDRIELRVRTRTVQSRPVVFNRTLSENARRNLRDSAEGISDERLAEAIRRLAAAGKPSSDS